MVTSVYLWKINHLHQLPNVKIIVTSRLTCSFSVSLVTRVLHLMMLQCLHLHWKQGQKLWTSLGHPFIALHHKCPAFSFYHIVTQAFVVSRAGHKVSSLTLYPGGCSLTDSRHSSLPLSQVLEVSGIIFSSCVHQVTSIDFSLLSSSPQPNHRPRVRTGELPLIHWIVETGVTTRSAVLIQHKEVDGRIHYMKENILTTLHVRLFIPLPLHDTMK